MASKIKLHNYGKIPKGYNYEYGSIGELDGSDAAELDRRGVVEGWYWYAYGSYEGTGKIIMRDEEGNWYGADLGHCSCYGPTERVHINDGAYPMLDALEASCTGDALIEFKPLIDMARSATTKKVVGKKKIKGFQEEKSKRKVSWKPRATNW